MAASDTSIFLAIEHLREDAARSKSTRGANMILAELHRKLDRLTDEQLAGYAAFRRARRAA